MRQDRRRFGLLAATLLTLPLLPATALAHGPTRQKVVEEININAAPADVWKLVGDWNNWAAWHPAIESSTASNGNEVDSVRVLKLKGGGQLEEVIEGYDAAAMTLKYRAKDHGALPVSNYTSAVIVKAADGGGSTVTWRGAFYRGFPNNDPPPDQNDEAAIKAVTAVYQTGLANLKAVAEKK